MKSSMNITTQSEQDRTERELLQQCLQSGGSSVMHYQDINRATQLNKYKTAAQYSLSSGLRSYANFIYVEVLEQRS